jgi:cell wall assembly regulator SMI1
MTTVFQKFSDRFNKNSDSKPAAFSDINALEAEFRILLPLDYKEFLQKFGDLWTPDILELVVEKYLSLNDVQDFWDTERIIEDKTNEWTSVLSVDLIPFASDSMGNIYAFKTEDLKKQKQTADIYFYDHDFDTVDKISNGFTEWLDNYNKI